MMSTSCILVIVCFIAIFIAIFKRFYSKRSQKKRDKTKPEDWASVLIVIGSGGHTTEILSLVKAMGSNYSPRYYVLAETDTTSENKVKECEKLKEKLGHSSQYEIFYIPRSREVKQSYLTSILTTLRAILYCLPLTFKLRPEVILCNGPGTCIPICIAGMFLKLWQTTSIVYVESFCRVQSLSLSGRLLYPFIDSFFVQWPELLSKYPNAKYVGRLV
uniref:UDP-N-acetylglucosamine transferase subunit ALG14 n=1 Tax=Biomphalaria glabrata TaxID=6526 RepID=A0A2C9LBD8_BIOGL